MNKEETRPAHGLDYVAGFLFDEKKTTVALIQKLKPEWQKGKLNAIGGKIEEGETPEQAMEREFEEETGAKVTGWRRFCDLSFRGGTVHFFETTGDLGTLNSVTEEQVRRIWVRDLDMHDTIPNLKWLVPLAADKDRVTAVVEDLS